jgi:hypothetical protein
MWVKSSTRMPSKGKGLVIFPSCISASKPQRHLLQDLSAVKVLSSRRPRVPTAMSTFAARTPACYDILVI